MTAILALAALGPWSYAGFLAEPPPAADRRPRAGPDADPAAASRRRRPGAAPTSPAASPSPQPPARRPRPPRSRRPPRADRPRRPGRTAWPTPAGQVWEHADPDYSGSFVEARNRSLRRTPRSVTAGLDVPLRRDAPTARCPTDPMGLDGPERS